MHPGDGRAQVWLHRDTEPTQGPQKTTRPPWLLDLCLVAPPGAVLAAAWPSDNLMATGCSPDPGCLHEEATPLSERFEIVEIRDEDKQVRPSRSEPSVPCRGVP